ncbi:hypothetical protein [Rummeliibacillus pycnus]|uniref:hypothetical protein n=1 Tax=Rummeliibacillus pycnus TaxID=101070 RepID=UPI003D2985EF
MKLTIPNVDEESNISKALMTSMMPFLFIAKKDKQLAEELLANGYKFFDLQDEDQQSAYYGDIHISNIALNQHFLPYIERRLFPDCLEDDAFRRFSKTVPKKGELVIHDRHYTFQILSVDVVLCPFGVGFVTIRIELGEGYSLSETLDFMHHFRILEPKSLDERGVRLYVSSFTFHSINDFIMLYLCPEIQPYIIHDEIRNGYYGSLPFFEDERMLVSSYIEVNEDQLPIEQLYRASQLDGYTEADIPLISAGNTEHMEEYLKTKINNRYMPKLCDITTEHVQTTIVFRQADDVLKEKARVRFMGIHYYNVLLHYFYKLTLLELSFRYSELAWKKDEIYIEKLMTQITMFSSKFYFQEVSSRSSSRETAKRLRSIFRIDELFGDVAKTLDALYVNQQKTADQRQNQLLFILTMFSVISGIFGMNLVVIEWNDHYDWTKIFGYSIYEWICLITAVAGILMSAGLLLSTIYTWGRRKIQYKKWY